MTRKRGCTFSNKVNLVNYSFTPWLVRALWSWCSIVSRGHRVAFIERQQRGWVMSEGLMKHVEIEKAFKSFINSPMISPLGIDMQPYYWQCRARFKMMIDSMPRLLEPINVLDVGPTHFTMLLKDFFPHYEISTIDLSNNWKDRCEAVGIQFKTCNLDEGHIPFPDNYFHVVIFTGVLEHIFAPPSDTLNELRRIMRPKGKLIIGVPNIARLNNRILFFWYYTTWASGFPIAWRISWTHTWIYNEGTYLSIEKVQYDYHKEKICD